MLRSVIAHTPWLLALVSVLLTSCGSVSDLPGGRKLELSDVEVSLKPSFIPLKLTYSSGKVGLELVPSFVTPLGTVDVKAGASIDGVLKENESKRLLVVRADELINKWELPDNQAFKVEFPNDQSYRLVGMEHRGKDSIVVELTRGMLTTTSSVVPEPRRPHYGEPRLINSRIPQDVQREVANFISAADYAEIQAHWHENPAYLLSFYIGQAYEQLKRDIYTRISRNELVSFTLNERLSRFTDMKSAGGSMLIVEACEVWSDVVYNRRTGVKTDSYTDRKVPQTFTLERKGDDWLISNILRHEGQEAERICA